MEGVIFLVIVESINTDLWNMNTLVLQRFNLTWFLGCNCVLASVFPCIFICVFRDPI